MKIIALIPARYAATRFPYKLMQPLGDKTVIRHTYDNTVATGLFDEVVVVTDSPLIFDEISQHGGKAIMSKNEHESGTDRIAEAMEEISADVVLNVQGDEPFIDAVSLQLLIAAFSDPKVKVASVMKPFTDEALVSNPNYVKVVVDQEMNSLLFSRSVIPYHRDQTLTPIYYEHIGVYAFKKEMLLQFTQWKMTPLESVEKIECLRFLENGVQLKMVVTQHVGVKIDVPDDLPRAAAYLQSLNG